MRVIVVVMVVVQVQAEGVAEGELEEVMEGVCPRGRTAPALEQQLLGRKAVAVPRPARAVVLLVTAAAAAAGVGMGVEVGVGVVHPRIVAAAARRLQGGSDLRGSEGSGR